MTDGQITPVPGSPNGDVRLRQDIETPLTPVLTPVGTALYLYARSIDSVSSNTVGQDYVAFRYGGTDLVFVVCDGVGQSFIGDLAARILGDGLIDWLWKLERPVDAESFSLAVRQSLNEMAVTSASKVTEYQLPPGLPPMLSQALEMQRQYGSESMFVAGRLALSGDDSWVALCWLGDAPVAAIDIDGMLVDLGPHGHTSERWNATTGVKGEVHAWVSTGKHVARVAGYTDGLGVSHVPTDADLARLVETWKDSPPSDDASLFDVRLAYSPQTVGEAEIPPQEILRLPAGIELPSSEPTFTADDTRPIVVEPPPTPVTGHEPISPAPSGGAVEGWRPLIDKKKVELPGTLSADTLASLSPQQQIQIWQQAALLGLTSAALAMMMLERLLKEQGSAGDTKGKT
jgi:hypothetical protein